MCRRPISRILSWTIIPLGDALLRRSSNLPAGFGESSTSLGVTGRRAPAAEVVARGLPAYLVLLRVGFTKPLTLPPTRWALTPPFHPYLPLARGAVYFLLHWPSTRLDARLPDVIRHTALRSSDFPPPPGTRRRGRQRSSSRLHSFECSSGGRRGGRPPLVRRGLLHGDGKVDGGGGRRSVDGDADRVAADRGCCGGGGSAGVAAAS